jgi:hypothetical protein
MSRIGGANNLKYISYKRFLWALTFPFLHHSSLHPCSLLHTFLQVCSYRMALYVCSLLHSSLHPSSLLHTSLHLVPCYTRSCTSFPATLIPLPLSPATLVHAPLFPAPLFPATLVLELFSLLHVSARLFLHHSSLHSVPGCMFVQLCSFLHSWLDSVSCYMSLYACSLRHSFLHFCSHLHMSLSACFLLHSSCTLFPATCPELLFPSPFVPVPCYLLHISCAMSIRPRPNFLGYCIPWTKCPLNIVSLTKPSLNWVRLML